MQKSTTSEWKASQSTTHDPLSAPSDGAPVVRLVPHSGIQFVDVTLSLVQLAESRHSFAEHRYAVGGVSRTVLMPLERVGSGDVHFHPVTQRALAPKEIMSVSGAQALESFAGRWIPIPYFRYLGRDEVGREAYDAGPENWARVFIAAGPDRTREATSINLTVAFDTRVEAPDRSGERRYLAPNSDDVLLGASFKLATGNSDLAQFAGRPWIDAWLRRSLEVVRGGAESVTRSEFRLEHVAHYLVMMDALGRYCAMPEVRLLDTLSKRWPTPLTSVDLVVDIGDADTAALLVDHAEVGTHGETERARPLTLRDLSRPAICHSGAIPTQVEFAPSPFGDAGLSRLSGRSDAFLWPSLVRIGHEAAERALQATSTVGVTGEARLPALLDQTEASEGPWRIGADGADGTAMGPIASGTVLAHLSEDGSLLSDTSPASARAVRPRFAPSSLLSFFVAELLLHAISAINAVARADDDPRSTTGARRLDRIVAAVPAAMCEDERARLVGQIETAIELLWRAMGWDGAAELGAPQRPLVTASPGTDVATQLYRVQREIADRFGNDTRAFLSAASAIDGEGSFARVASIEFGQPKISAVIVDYTLGPDGALTPRQAIADTRAEGAGAAIDVLSGAFVLPAITSALTASGMKAPELFLSRALDATTARLSSQRNLARRLLSKVVKPAAAALLQLADELPPGVAAGRRIFTLRTLVERGGGRLEPQTLEFDRVAGRDGAPGFSLERVEVKFSQRQLDAALRSAAKPGIRHVCDLVVQHSCDLLFVSGPFAQVPSVVGDLTASLPMEPSRIVVEAEAEYGQAPGAGQTGTLAPDRVAGVAGAYLAGQGALGFESVRRVSESIGRDADRPMPLPNTARDVPTVAVTPASERAGGLEP